MKHMKIKLTGEENLHVNTEDNEIYLTLRSDGCSPYPVRSVMEAVQFTEPDLTTIQTLTKTRTILDQIVIHLTETNNNN